jgi:hypothetical protein
MILYFVFLSIFYKTIVYMPNYNGNNCTKCVACFNNCSSCPKHTCEVDQMNLNNMARVNKQVRMDSSRYMMMRRVGMVSKQVGQSAMPKNLGQAGGPGDLISAIQKNCQTTSKGNPNEWKKVTYRVPTVKARTAYRGQSGVDKKHGSYARFLARRVGGVLRKEKMPGIIAKTAIIKQPRNRTGTNSGARAESRISTKVNYCLSDNARGPQGFRLLGNAPSFSAYSGFRDKVTTYNKTRNPYNPSRLNECPSTTPEIGKSTCFSTKCCDNRRGNNVCEPGPKKKKCVSKDATNNLTVGNNSDVLLGFYPGDSGDSGGGDFTPQTIGGQVVEYCAFISDPPFSRFLVQTTTGGQLQTLFSSISFINCEDNTVRTYNTAAASFTGNTWSWDAAASGFSAANEFAYWYALNPNTNTSLGKTVKVVIDDNTLAPTGTGTGDYCCTNN